jgi:hypothetical protein
MNTPKNKEVGDALLIASVQFLDHTTREHTPNLFYYLGLEIAFQWHAAPFRKMRGNEKLVLTPSIIGHACDAW